MFVSYIPYDTTVSGVADDLIPLDYIVYYGREDDENDKNKTLRDVIVQDLKSKIPRHVIRLPLRTQSQQTKTTRFQGIRKPGKRQ